MKRFFPLFVATLTFLVGCQNLTIDRGFAMKSEEIGQVSNDFIVTNIDLVNRYGDSTFITYKGLNILIDAGGNLNSLQTSVDSNGEKTITNGPHLNPIFQKIKDVETIDILIFSHCDTDHINNFNDNKDASALGYWLNGGIDLTDFEENTKRFDPELETKRKIKCLIDFDGPVAEKVLKNDKGYSNYKSFRDSLLNSGKIESYLNPNGWQKPLDDLTEDFLPFNSFSEKGFGFDEGIYVLENYYSKFDSLLVGEETINVRESAIKNCLSLAVLIKANGRKCLFTGDLEEFNSQGQSGDSESEEYTKDNYLDQCDEKTRKYQRIYGESLLTTLNYDLLKDGVDYYKAAHHGSITSNSSNLLDVIRPKYIAISAGMVDNYSSIKTKFPHQVALFNMFKWTDKVYISDIYNNDTSKYQSYYGDIIYTAKANGEETFTSSNLINGKISDTSIFTNKDLLSNKDISINIFDLGQYNAITFGINDSNTSKVLSQYKGFGDEIEPLSLKECFMNVDEDDSNTNRSTVTNCTYIKIGSIDILVNNGANINPGNDLSAYRNNKKIEYLCNDKVIDYLIITNYASPYLNGLIKGNGLLKSSKITKINNVISHSFNQLKDDAKELFNEQKIIQSNHIEINGNEEMDILSNNDTSFSIQFLDNGKAISNYLDCNLSFVFSINSRTQNFNYFYASKVTNYEELNYLIENNANVLANVDAMAMPAHGYLSNISDSEIYQYTNALKKISRYPDKIYLTFNGSYRCNSSYPSFDFLSSQYSNIKIAYTSLSLTESKSSNVYGNIVTRAVIGKFKKDQVNRVLMYGTNALDYISGNVSNTLKSRIN